MGLGVGVRAGVRVKARVEAGVGVSKLGLGLGLGFRGVRVGPCLRKERPKPPTACSSSEPELQSSEIEMSGDSVSVTETHWRRIDHEEPPTLV